MRNFNYQKAYCVQAVPAFNNLPTVSRDVHSKLVVLIGELRQDRQLLIPMDDTIRAELDRLTTKQLAELSRTSYFVGHWQPGLLDVPFENKRGESWKISNCCDQVLRERLNPPYNIQIHEGKLRVTFSDRDCWLWGEFGLATEENLGIFKTCGLPFGETGLESSAKILTAIIGDLWEDIDTVEDNGLYREYLRLEQQNRKARIIKNHENKIKSLEQKKIDAQTEIDALLWLNEKGYLGIDNCIYYSHTGRFCFGWREKLSESEKSELSSLLEEFPFDYDLK